MNRKNHPLEDWQGILFVSPKPFNGVPELPQARTQGFYKIVHALDNPQALRIIERDLPAIIVLNAFMDSVPRSIDKSLNLIQEARSREFNALIVSTSTVPIDDIRLDRMLTGGANIYLHAERLKQELPKIVKSYEKIMLCNKEFMEGHPELINEVRQATLHINKQYLQRYFKRNPGVAEIKIDPWRINRFIDNEEVKLDDCGPCSYCFQYLREEITKN